MRWFFTATFAIYVSMLSSAKGQIVDEWSMPRKVTVKAASYTEVIWKGDLDTRHCRVLSTPSYVSDNPGTLGRFETFVRQEPVRERGRNFAQCLGTEVPLLYIYYRAGSRQGTERISFMINTRGVYRRYMYQVTVE